MYSSNFRKFNFYIMEIDILALGQSIDKYRDSGNITIGVNDIFKIHPVNNLVVVDTPSVFNATRLHTIINSTPNKFYSCSNDWRTMVSNFQHIKLDKFPGCLDGLDDRELVCYSNNSAFVATVIAYKMKAKRIVLYGVDFTAHHFLSQKEILQTQLKHFSNLHSKFKEMGVELYVADKRSELSKFIPVV